MSSIRPKQVLETLPELVDPAHTALLVVDLQNDLCADGGIFADRGADLSMYDEMMPRVAELIDAARAAGVMVIYTQATTLPGGLSQSPAQLLFERRLEQNYGKPGTKPFEFCVPGTWGHDILDVIKPADGDLVIQKYRSSSFRSTELDLLLRSNDIRTVVVTGCTTEGCVDSTIRDAGFLDYYPVGVRDCMASDDPKLHESALYILESYRAWMTDSRELLDVWSDKIGDEAHG